MAVEFLKSLEFILRESARYKVVWGGRGAGKCLGLGTKVIMFDGTLRAVEDVREGELVMGPDDKPRKVLGTTRGHSQLYKVKQANAIDYVVNSSHIISLKKSDAAINDKGPFLRNGYKTPNGRYGNYPTITNINVIEAKNQSARWKANFRGYKSGYIDFPDKPVAIDPWYLGAWLGDGRSNDTIIYSMDDEVIEACEKYAFQLGMKVVYYEQNSKAVGIALRKFEGRNNFLFGEFETYNLFNNKHIPQEYISNSEEVRLQLLAGLLDTDGYLHNNGYEIAQVNKRLAYEIKYLADTLGFRTYIREKKTVCGNNGVEGIAYRLTIGGDTWRIPCKVERKIVKKEDVNKIKDFLLSSIDIEPIGYGEYAGFSLDGDHLFLLEDGTVTHNSEGIATALIVLALNKRLRIACFREFQKSIKESVHSIIKQKIYDMEVQNDFNITDVSITCLLTGSEFIFSGLRHNIDSIKSMARIDIAWVEEANNVSATSWKKLGPTIRGRHETDPNGMGGPFSEGPEIIISFNPEMAEDETYKRFILKPPHEFDNRGKRFIITRKINWQDNPWFPDDLRAEMEECRARSEDEYLEVWEGHTKQVLDGAIYAEEIRKVIKENRLGKVPYDSSRPVHTFWDLGRNDHTSIWFIQTVGMEFNVIDYYENRLKKMPWYIGVLQEKKYVYGVHNLPHDGSAETLSNVTPEKQLRNMEMGRVRIIQRPPRKFVGINAVRTVLDLCNFDEENTVDGFNCLRRYCYDVDEATGGFSKEPKHDEFSNGADGFQTFALSLKSETAGKKKEPKTVGVGQIRPSFRPGNNWMGG